MLNNVLDAVDATMNVTDMNDMTNEAVPTASDLIDPLDEPLKEQLVLDGIYYEAARQYVTVDGMDYSFEKPRYMLYDDQARAKRKLKEAYSQKEFLFTYGFSGSGKTTMLEQFSERYPNFVHLHTDFSNLSPAGMLVWMGQCIGLPLKQRTSEIFTLEEHLRNRNGVMYLFDEVTADTKGARLKIDNLRKIHMATGVPIVIYGTFKLYNALFSPKYEEDNCSVISRLDVLQMHGMQRQDAGKYLEMLAREESLRFTYPAQQALISMALNQSIGALHAFTTVIARCITYARVYYYKQPGRAFPDKSKCIRPVVKNGASYPGAELMLTPPATPEPVLIDERLVSESLNNYKGNFPKIAAKREQSSEK